jgi:Fic family protein
MRIVREEEDPAFFRFITDGNLLRQFDFLKAQVIIALREPDAFRLSHDLVRKLNDYGVANICETAGMYRKVPIWIRGSPHEPPKWDKVPEYMDTFLGYLDEAWKRASPTHLAAYALWRINWIHPFVEGNGRTARALCYLILCVHHRMWLPGRPTIPKLIRANLKPYYNALRECDRHSDQERGRVELGSLEDYLNGLLAQQLAS